MKFGDIESKVLLGTTNALAKLQNTRPSHLLSYTYSKHTDTVFCNHSNYFWLIISLVRGPVAFSLGVIVCLVIFVSARL